MANQGKCRLLMGATENAGL